jgi:ubiquinone/menaquinone biosynthesis C-methylase UbiE
MVNLANYDEGEDFAHHRKEFELFAENISKYTELEGLRILDLCAGKGKHLGFLVNTGAEFVLGTDICDYRGIFAADYHKEVYDYYKKYDCELRSSDFALVRSDSQELAIRRHSCDVVFCINAFEHLPSPEKALLEIYRILRPRGYAFISFTPTFYSDTGSHMIDFVKEPWAHLADSEEEYIEKLRNATAGTEYWVNEYKYALNRLPRKYYYELLERHTVARKSFVRKWLGKVLRKGGKCFEVLERRDWYGVQEEAYLEHENFKQLQGIYLREDLLFRGMYLLLRKIG